MYRIELITSGRVFEVSRTEGNKQVSKSLGISLSQVLRIIYRSRLSAFPVRVRICFVKSTVMNWDITGVVLLRLYL